MTPGTVVAAGGTMALVSFTVAGIFGAGVYCTAPDVYSYASGQAVRQELGSSLTRGRLTLFLAALYLAFMGLLISGPMVMTVTGLPLYTISVVVFVGGFSYFCCREQIPLPETVTVPFLCLGLVHEFPNMASIGNSALGLAAIFFARWLAGLLIVGFLTATDDATNPRLFGLVSDDTWILFAGAAAWVGQDHIISLIVCALPFTLIGIILSASGFSAQCGGARRNRLSPYCSDSGLDRTASVVPWEGLITISMLIEMVIHHEASHSVLSTLLPNLISRHF